MCCVAIHSAISSRTAHRPPAINNHESEELRTRLPSHLSSYEAARDFSGGILVEVIETAALSWVVMG